MPSIRLIVYYILFTVTFPVSLYYTHRVVKQYERIVIWRAGRPYKNRAHGPGLVHELSWCGDDVRTIDLRIISYKIPRQEVLTKDSLSVAIDGALFYKIVDPVLLIVNVEDYRSSTQLLAASSLRGAIGKKNLTDILADREVISTEAGEEMDKLTQNWGIKVLKLEIKDISLPASLQKSMAQEAATIKLTKAKVIVTNAEIEATRNLEKATAMLTDNTQTMQLRYLQTLHTIVDDKTHTIVFPFSISTFRKIFYG